MVCVRWTRPREAHVTDAEWLSCDDPTPMLAYLEGKASDRKLRLFAVACCRRVWEALNEDGRRAVEAAEGFADGLIAVNELRDSGLAARLPVDDYYDRANLGGHGVVLTGHLAASESAFITCSPSFTLAASDRTAQFALLARGDPSESLMQCRLLRDIIGNPFHLSPPVSFAVLAWNDGIVRKMAQVVYEERAFDRLPILADALEDAGCTDGEILAHCRGPGPHVRGCWVVDLLLGRS